MRARVSEPAATDKLVKSITCSAPTNPRRSDLGLVPSVGSLTETVPAPAQTDRLKRHDTDRAVYTLGYRNLIYLAPTISLRPLTLTLSANDPYDGGAADVVEEAHLNGWSNVPPRTGFPIEVDRIKVLYKDTGLEAFEPGVGLGLIGGRSLR